MSQQPRKAVAGARNVVRIIGGSWRGRRVKFPDVPGLRPTPDRVRETLFNWLQHTIAAARCLDLFAGSGALGLEALSRGAREVVFVESSAAAAGTLRAELERLGGAARARVMETSAERFLRAPPSDAGEPSGAPFGEPFDVAFLDPPFGRDALADYVPRLAAGGWVKPGGFVYLESERAAGAPTLPRDWELLKSKSAGEVGYHLVRVKARPVGDDE